MRIGVPTEVKNNEFRVAITPAGAMELTRHGHDVLVQSGAGLGSSISDAGTSPPALSYVTRPMMSGATPRWC